MTVTEAETRYPEPDDTVGWQCLVSVPEVREQAGMDPWRLGAALEEEAGAAGDHTFGLAVVRHGFLVAELYSRNVGAQTRFGLWSCTKSFTSLAWGLAFDRSAVRLDTPIYGLIPGAGPLSDPRKEGITVGHVLSMTSGIAGESRGIVGMPTRPDHGVFEYALGHAPNRFNQWVAVLEADPGTRWDYSDAAFSHLSLAFRTVMGEEIAAVMERHVFSAIGAYAAWDRQGGCGFRGPHTNAHSGLALSARDLARVGYLLLRRGRWNGKEVVPNSWIETATLPSQDLNPSYGYGFWTNAENAMTPGLPRDAFMLAGFHENRCYVVPSADLVVVRVGTGSDGWSESRLLGGVLAAIL